MLNISHGFAEAAPEESASADETVAEALAEESDTKARAGISVVPIVVPRPQPDPAASGLRALAGEMTAKQLLWLNGQEESTETAMALYLPANRPLMRGGMLLLHDKGQHPDWPQIISKMRKAMPDEGWVTLSLALVYPEQDLLPDRTMLARGAAGFPFTEAKFRGYKQLAEGQNDEITKIAKEDAAASALTEATEESSAEVPSELPGEVDIDAAEDAEGSQVLGNVTDKKTEKATESTAAIKKPELSNFQRIGLGLQQLEVSGVLNIVVLAVGEGAEIFLMYLQEMPEAANRVQGMVWINSQFDHGLLRDLSEQAPDWTGIKILDIYDPVQRHFKETAEKRREFASRLGLSTYRSVSMSGLSVVVNSPSQRLFKRVGSWLERALPSRGLSAP